MKRGEELSFLNHIGKPMIWALFERKTFKECPSFIMGRDPVELAKRAKYKPPAMRVRDVGYTKKSPFRYKIRLFKPIYNERKGDFMANKVNSLSHTKWVCKYHIVFTPKYRRKIIYNQYKESIRDIIKQLCAYKGVEILEGHLMPDHIHMLVSIPPKLSVSQFIGYLKGKSSLMIFDKHANLKYKFGNRHFWAEGYYVSTVGLNEATMGYYSDQYYTISIREEMFDMPREEVLDTLLHETHHAYVHKAV